MKAIQIPRFGAAHEVAELIDLPEPQEPVPGEVTVRVELALIDPSDLARAAGAYPGQDTPYLAGSEGLGRVEQVGVGVEHLQPGDRVLLFGLGAWRERLNVKANRLSPLPDGVDPLQMAQLSINPPTAYFMLHEFVELQPGDWVVQNAGNSAVAGYVSQLARGLGARTINIVRRESAVEAAREAGADAVLVDDRDLAARVRDITGDAMPRLALDAVAGTATGRLADCLARGGTLVTYGALSGEPCRVLPSHFIFRDIRHVGYLLTHSLNRLSPDQVRDVYARLGGMIARGELKSRVGRQYALTDFRDALSAAARGGQDGKIMFAPNGPVTHDGDAIPDSAVPSNG